MKKFVTYLSIFGAGIAIGIFGTKTYFEQKYKDISDNEIESVKEVYKRKEAELKNKDSALDPKEKESKDTIGEGLFLNMTPEHMKKMQINYHTVSDDISVDHPIETDYKPYFINIDEFDEVNDGYSKHEYVYYMDDGTLADALAEAAVNQTDIEEDIVSASDTVGIDNIELFEKMDDEVCYIRNEYLGADYEITKIFSSYSATVGDNY